MGDLFEIIKKRKSIRRYSSRPVEKEKIIKMAEAARLSPSASNKQPWRFVAVTDKDLIRQAVKQSLGAINTWAKTAPCLIVGCSVRKDIITHWIAEAASGVKYHLLDMGISMEHMVLEAEELGLSTCWIGWFNEKKLKKILKIPPAWRVASLISVGYRDEQFKPRARKKLPMEKILIFR
ncbi:MAG: nitroreductase family protein [Actinomycetota bacterium]